MNKELEKAAREYYKRGQLGLEKAADTEIAFLNGARWQQEQLLIHVIPKQEESWDKMGDNGNENYQYNEESYWLGYYRALEDIEEKFKNILPNEM